MAVVDAAGWVEAPARGAAQAAAAGTSTPLSEAKVERESQRRLAGAEDARRRAEVALGARSPRGGRGQSGSRQERALRRRAEAELAKITPTLAELRVAAQRGGAPAEGGRGRARAADGGPAPRPPRDPHARGRARTGRSGPDAALKSVASGHARRADAPTPPRRRNWSASSRTRRPTPSGCSASLAVAADLLTPRSNRIRLHQRRRSRPRSRKRSAASPSACAPERWRTAPRRRSRCLRTPGAVLLVDGYNISHAVWWDQPIAEQRDRLVGALTELHARTGVEVDVVFDGAEVERVRADVASPRRARPLLAARRRGRRRHHRHGRISFPPTVP